jgi:hypothetical protein
LIAAFITSACASPLSAKSGQVTAPPQDLAGGGFSTDGWKTDFSKHGVPLSEISSGGPPRDGIPPLDHPQFVKPEEAAKWIKGREPVIALDLDGSHRAYPLQILIWHEIVNDQVARVPVTVTFCPLCDTAIVFDRRVDGRILDFGTSGNLRKSDLVMWDRQTESWWQQATGTAIVGALTGTVLSVFPAAIVSFSTFSQAYPDGSVLSRETGFDRTYGENPYPGYDDAKTPPFLFKGPTDGRLPPKEKVVAVSVGGDDVAYPYSVLQKRGVVQDTVGGTPIAVFYQSGTASALGGSSIPDSPDGGATGVFKVRLADRQLTFRAAGNRFVDAETGSSWDLLGRAVSGPLAGGHLEAVIHGDHFWFAWAAFRPATRIYRG